MGLDHYQCAVGRGIFGWAAALVGRGQGRSGGQGEGTGKGKGSKDHRRFYSVDPHRHRDLDFEQYVGVLASAVPSQRDTAYHR